VYAVLGAAFAIAVVKHSSGGLGSNWMNPALGGWLFVYCSWPAAFGRALERASQTIPEAATSAGSAIGGFLNRAVFWFFGAELPPAYIDLFSLQTPGIIADRAALALVVTTAIIAAFQISRSWMSLVFLAVYGLLVRMAGDLHVEGLWWNGDIIFAFLSGGALVTAFILIADPSSGPKSAAGCLLTAVLAAALSFAFRYIGGVFYGCFFAVALINALTPLLCKFEKKIFYSRPPVSAPAGGKK
jgi:electron transport complex protein RnfD